VETEQARVSLETLLGCGLDRILASAGQPHDHGHNHHAEHQTAVIEVQGNVDPECLARQLAMPELGLTRAKGFVRDRAGTLYAVQTVGQRWEARPTVREVHQSGRIVCIAHGQQIDLEAINRRLEEECGG